MRDETASRCFGFVSFDSFESSDAAIAAMNGQYISGRPITVTYALKKDSKTERHGSAAERILAARNPNTGLRNRPNQLFANPYAAPGVMPMAGVAPYYGTGYPYAQQQQIPGNMINRSSPQFSRVQQGGGMFSSSAQQQVKDNFFCECVLCENFLT